MSKKIIGGAVAVIMVGGLALTQASAFAATGQNNSVPTAISTGAALQSTLPSLADSTEAHSQTGGADVGPNVQQQTGSQVNDSGSSLAAETAKETNGKKADGGVDSGPNVQIQSGSQVNNTVSQ